MWWSVGEAEITLNTVGLIPTIFWLNVDWIIGFLFPGALWILYTSGLYLLSAQMKRFRIPAFVHLISSRGGVNPQSLWLLGQAPQAANNTTDDSAPTRIALVNARSLANKTFILNDFFSSHGLDFLFVTETWLCVGE